MSFVQSIKWFVPAAVTGGCLVLLGTEYWELGAKCLVLGAWGFVVYHGLVWVGTRNIKD